MKPVIQIFPGARFNADDGIGQGDAWFVRVVSPNGETLLVSESYTRKFSARRAAKRLSRIFGGLRILEVPK